MRAVAAGNAEPLPALAGFIDRAPAVHQSFVKNGKCRFRLRPMPIRRSAGFP